MVYKILLGALIAAGAMQSAWAGYAVDEAVQPAAAPASVVATSGASDRVDLVGGAPASDRRQMAVTQIGFPPAQVPVVTGFSRSLPFRDTLKAIVPTGWHAFASRDFPASTPVTYSGNGRPWIQVLNEVMLANDMNAEVNWDKQEVNVSRARAPMASAASAMQAAPARPQWLMKKDVSLAENLTAMAIQGGWNLVWKPSDLKYLITVDTPLNGELVGENGVVAQVIRQYENADRPLKVTFYGGNKVILIEEVPKSPTETAQSPSDARPSR
jgi:hypothetical protein